MILIICKGKHPRHQMPMCPWRPREDPLDVVFAAIEDRARRVFGRTTGE